MGCMLNRTGGAVVGLGVAPTTYQRDFVGAEVVAGRGGGAGESAKRDEKIGESIEGSGGSGLVQSLLKWWMIEKTSESESEKLRGKQRRKRGERKRKRTSSSNSVVALNFLSTTDWCNWHSPGRIPPPFYSTRPARGRRLRGPGLPVMCAHPSSLSCKPRGTFIHVHVHFHLLPFLFFLHAHAGLLFVHEATKHSPTINKTRLPSSDTGLVHLRGPRNYPIGSTESVHA
jgi:hypothetical protein